MTYTQAQRTIWLYYILGGAIFVVTTVWMVASVLTWAYLLPIENNIAYALMQPMRSVIVFVYQKTNGVIGFIWKNPIPFNGNFLDFWVNKYLYCTYFISLLAVDRISVAKKLATMIKIAKQQLAQAQISEGLAAHYGHGIAGSTTQNTTNHQTAQTQGNIPKPKWFTTFHALYLAPLLVGIALFFVQKVFV